MAHIKKKKILKKDWINQCSKIVIPESEKSEVNHSLQRIKL